MNLLDEFESEFATYCKYRLANGLTVIVVRRPHTRTFGMCMELNVGMRDGEPHLAHMVEHLVLSHLWRSSPADLNGFTQFSKTKYFLSAHLDELKSGFEMVKRVLMPLEASKKQVKDEIAILAREFLESGGAQLIFNREHYRVLGGDKLAAKYEKALDGVRLSISAKAVNDFHDKHYQPRNATLAIVSPLDPDEVIQNVAAVVASFENSNDPDEAVDRQTINSPMKRFHTDWYYSMPTVCVWHKMLNANLVDRVALKVLNSILGGAGRFFDEIRVNNSLCYGVYTQFDFFDDTNWHFAFVSVSRRNTQLAARLLDEVIENVAVSMSEDAFENKLTGFVQQCDLVEEEKWGLLEGLLNWNACEDRLLPPAAIKKIALELKPEQVAGVAKRFFSPENRYWLLSGGFGPTGYFKVKRIALK